jgi:hypothetical protein
MVTLLLLFSIAFTYAQPKKKQIRHHKHHKHIMKHPAKRKRAVILDSRGKEVKRKELKKE